MRSMRLTFIAVCLLSVYGIGCDSGSPGSTDAKTDAPKDAGKDVVSDVPSVDVPADKPDAGDVGGPDAKSDALNDAKDASTDVDVGGPPPCMVATDCPGMDSECAHRTCTAGVCGMANETVGKVLATQTIGDCKVRQCGANGAVTTANDDKDIPDDINPCTKDACAAGVASHTPVATNTTCGGGKMCNATGQCVGCNTAADCPGTDNFCRTRTCVQSICGVTYKTAGTKLVDATSGDCKIQQCDGAGVIQTVADATDLPVDNNPCTQDQCNGTTPTHQPVARNTSCGNGQVCDGASKCVTCLTAATCPGTDTECQARTCTNGACGVAFTAAGTGVMGQVTGDCRKRQCDGHGVIISATDDTDVLVDNNPCTKDLCMSGSPTNPPVAARTVCGTNLQCDGLGRCVQCLGVADCPGTDNECQARTCIDGMCGTKFTAVGTPVANQTVGDCKVNQCDGKGATVTVQDNTDPQDDNNACTSDVCSNGNTMHANVAAKTACGTNLECDGSGHCVGCIQPSECGVDTECNKNTCTNGMCGTTPVAKGTLLSIQMAKDCKKNQCNGAGQPETVPDDTDLPVDGLTCTNDVCMNGAPSNPPVAPRTICAMGGTMCNATGTCVQCIGAADCPFDPAGCQTATCIAGVCGVMNAGVGTEPVGVNQTSGDCQQIVCDGNGHRTSVAANGDKPVDNNQCTDDVCTAGVPSNPKFGTDVTCNQNGGAHCDGAGNCVVCNVDAECVTPMDTFCLKHTCMNHLCVDTSSPMAGTLVPGMQMNDDCQDVVCDASHQIVSVTNSTDNNDSNPCTDDSCQGSMPVHNPSMAGTACGNGMCNGAGRCDKCLKNSDCGSDTECATQICDTNAGTCTTQFKAPGFVLATQTPDDCKQRQCDGTDTPASVQDPNDNDDGNPCTTDSCMGTTPVHDPKTLGTMCMVPNGMVCNANGVCVGCNTDADCGGTSADGCKVNVCNLTNNTCGRADPVAGTPANVAQPTGDCKANVCDGIGNVVSANDDSDKPDDQNDCTDNVCTSGTPSNPKLATGALCNQNGGNRCDSSAHCVPTFMVTRIGDPAGSTATTSGPTMVNVELRAQSDGSVLTTTPMPTVAKGSDSTHPNNNPLTMSGTASSEGGLTRSTDTHFVSLAGYSTVPNPAGSSVKNTTAAAVPRVVGLIDVNGNVDTTTTLGGSAFNTDNVRNAATDDGTRFWVSGDGTALTGQPSSSSRGVFFASLHGTASTQVDGLKGSRICSVVLGNLYCTADKPVPTNNVFKVGSGLPDGSGGTTSTFTSLNVAMPMDSNASPFAFVLIGNPTLTTLYVADERPPAAGTNGGPDTGGGIQKWTSANGTSWTLNAVFDVGLTNTTAGVRGLTADTSSGNVVLIATTAPGTGPNSIVTCTDNGVMTQAAVPAFTSIAASGTSTFFRGVALPPK